MNKTFLLKLNEYAKRLLGLCTIVMVFVGIYVIRKHEIYSFSQMFIEYREQWAWVLGIIGLGFVWLRVDVGIGFVGLAIFYDGWVHNYIMSPLIIVVMAWYYVRMGSYKWLIAQAIIGIIQGYLYVVVEEAARDYFYWTEAIGFFIGGAYFLLAADRGRSKYFNVGRILSFRNKPSVHSSQFTVHNDGEDETIHNGDENITVGGDTDTVDKSGATDTTDTKN